GIWKTDRRNPDTDGDGTPDNEEILAGRDPLAPGPNDTLDSSAATSSLAVSTSTDLTEQLSRNFFGPYLELKQTGQFNEFNKERLLRNVTQNTAQTFTSATIPETAFTVQAGDPDLVAYGTALDDALTPILSLEDELAMTYRALVEKSVPDIEDRLSEHARLYSEAADALTQVPVPEAISEEHIKLTNIVVRQAEVSTALKGTFEDPLRGLLMLRVADENALDARASMTALLRYLTEQTAP
ncbi:hypothetical protein GVX82_03630, partial [Patescibacteria group bacterium]|nr:hypothetical protein [Patescibacteria group bacterium]